MEIRKLFDEIDNLQRKIIQLDHDCEYWEFMYREQKSIAEGYKRLAEEYKNLNSPKSPYREVGDVEYRK